MAKKVILLGIGTSGSYIVDSFAQKQKLNSPVICCAMDTDSRVLERINYAEKILLAREGCIEDAIFRLGKEQVRDYFPCEDTDLYSVSYVNKINLDGGANLWRSKALLMLQDFLADETRNQTFLNLFKNEEPETEIHLYIIASLCGGTGSGLFSFLAEYLKESVASIQGLLLCPDIYEDLYSAEQQIMIQANAYTALRELNAKDCNHTNPFTKIYLFQKNRTLQSVPMQEQWIGAMLPAILSNDDGNTPANGTVYASASYTKILRPTQDLIEYISRKCVIDAVFTASGADTGDVEGYFKQLVSFLQTDPAQRVLETQSEQHSKQSLHDAATAGYETLCKLYASGVEGYERKKTRLTKCFTAESHAISVFAHLLCPDGQPLSPQGARDTLVQLAEKIKQYTKDVYADEYLKPGPIEQSVKAYFSCLSVSDGKCKGKYAGGTKHRFVQLLSKDKSVCGNKPEDYTRLKSDLFEICDAILQTRSQVYMVNLLPVVEQLIAIYNKILGQIRVCRQEANSDLRLCGIRNSGRSGWTQHVLGTQEDKEKAYHAYRQNGNTREIFELCYVQIAFYARKMLDAACSFQDLLESIYEKSFAFVTDDPFVLQYFNQNMPEIIAEHQSDDAFVTAVHRGYCFNQPSLRVSIVDDRVGNRNHTAISRVFISEDARDSKELIEKLLYDFGEMASAIDVAPWVSPQEICFYRELGNVQLQEVLCMNEEESESLEQYQKAIQMMKRYRTPMWNPCVYFNTWKGGCLPHISPVTEERWKKKVVKAFFYAVFTERLFLDVPEDGTEPVYFYFNRGHRQPCLWNDSYIEQGDWSTVLKWIQTEEEWLQNWSEAFDSCVQKEIQALPGMGFGEYGVQEISKGIRESSMYSELSRHLLEMAAGAGVDGVQMLHTGKDVLHTYCCGKMDADSAEYDAVYQLLEADMLANYKGRKRTIKEAFCAYRRKGN